MTDELTTLDILKIVSPGTSLRTAIDDLVRARLGALIVFFSEKLPNLFEGGFRINSKLTSQRIVELCKMDGAVIITPDRKKILYANTLITPDKNFPTSETGTRHQAAERIAKQAETIAIAVSERKNKVTIYYRDVRYTLRSSEELLRRATEILQILEKQREIYDSLLISFNILEIASLTTVRDVCLMLQRVETISKISEEINKYLLELGREGFIIRMRFKELTLNIEETEKQILEDYTKVRPQKLQQILSNLSFEGLLDIKSIAQLIFYKSPEEKVMSRGRRLLKNTSLSNEQITSLTDSYKNLDTILNQNEENLLRVIKDPELTRVFMLEVEKLKEKILSGKNS